MILSIELGVYSCYVMPSDVYGIHVIEVAVGEFHSEQPELSCYISCKVGMVGSSSYGIWPDPSHSSFMRRLYVSAVTFSSQSVCQNPQRSQRVADIVVRLRSVTWAPRGAHAGGDEEEGCAGITRRTR